MKEPDAKVNGQEMRSHYDFTGGVRGKYSDRFSEKSTVVELDPDVSASFPDAASVNEALRGLIEPTPKVRED